MLVAIGVVDVRPPCRDAGGALRCHQNMAIAVADLSRLACGGDAADEAAAGPNGAGSRAMAVTGGPKPLSTPPSVLPRDITDN
jgi:hypothetical protein